jgi:hypothetical protein
MNSNLPRVARFFVLLLAPILSANAASAESAAEISRKLADPTSDIWAMFTAFQG